MQTVQLEKGRNIQPSLRRVRIPQVCSHGRSWWSRLIERPECLKAQAERADCFKLRYHHAGCQLQPHICSHTSAELSLCEFQPITAKASLVTLVTHFDDLLWGWQLPLIFFVKLDPKGLAYRDR